MRIGFFEVVLIVAVLLSIAVVWRWLREGRNGQGDDEKNEPGEGSGLSFFGRLGIVGVLFVLAGLGILTISYIIFIGLAKVFIWAVVIVLFGVAFLLLSRRY
jgi:hypothetical protein